jgi:ParB-like chromosome segregation protein Spo0J
MKVEGMALISRTKLHPNPENPFPSLPKDEYMDLRDSIKSHGIMEPLLIIKDEDSSTDFIVIVGNHRLKAAEELDIPEIPCIIIELDKIESAYQTELYRRVLSRGERDRYAQEIRKLTIKNQRVQLKESLIDELYSLYENEEMTSIPREAFPKLSRLSKEEQLKVYEAIMDTIPSSPKNNTQDQDAKKTEKARLEEIARVKQQTAELGSRIKTLEREKQDLKKQNREAAQVLRDKMDELEEVRERSTEKAAEIIKEQVTQQITTVQTQVTRNSEIIKEKDREIEAMREERDKAKRAYGDLEAKAGSVWLASRTYYDQCRTAMQKIFRPDLLRKRITTIKNELDVLETVWTSYEINEELQEEALKELRTVHNRLGDLLKTLPEIKAPTLPAITKLLVDRSKGLITEETGEGATIQ